jgi:acyl carrier protein
VKIRGHRIESGEVEVALRQHPLVGEAVVAAREDTPGDRRLVAYVVPANGQPPTVGQLRSHLAERLPEYMIPSVFVTLEGLPLTPNGKVDHKALPAADGARPKLEAAYVAPQTETERLVAAVWREELKVEEVGVNDNFFELGGHSLLLVKVHQRLRETLGRELTLIDLFKYPTIKSLTAYLGDGADGGRAARQAEDLAEQLSAGKQRMKRLFGKDRRTPQPTQSQP